MKFLKQDGVCTSL